MFRNVSAVPLSCLLLLLLSTGCGSVSSRPLQHPAAPSATVASSVWALDLVRTRPGQQQEYLRGIAANWARARQMALVDGHVRSYRALVTLPDSARGWDIALLTEYADSATFARREPIFARIFGDTRFAAGQYTSPKSSADLRTFFASEVVLREVAGSGR